MYGPIVLIVENTSIDSHFEYSDFDKTKKKDLFMSKLYTMHAVLDFY